MKIESLSKMAEELSALIAEVNLPNQVMQDDEIKFCISYLAMCTASLANIIYRLETLE